MTAIVVRSQVTAATHYGAHRESLRFDFFYSCAYCSVTEFESHAFGFQIDHYQPELHGGTDDYGNLYWTCSVCNRSKDGYWPSPTGLQNGYRIVRIDHDNPDDHLEVDPDDADKVRAKTNTGTTTISILEMNTQRLRRIRELRRRFGHTDQTIANGLRKLASARVDQLPSDLKALTFKLREELKARAKDVPEELAELVRSVGKSDLIDEDPDAKAHNRSRKDFLTKTGALPMRRKRGG